MAVGALACLGASPALAVPTAAPGYLLRTYPTPDTVQGGVYRRGNDIFVGQGAYGPGLQQIVRLEGTLSTIIATGFGSLGGMDVDGSGALWTVDNCWVTDFQCDTSTTGDTLYEIDDAVGRTTAVTADASAVLPNGSIGFPFDVLVAPGQVLVSNSVGPGAGSVVKVVNGVLSGFATGFDYTAGLASDGGAVYVGNSNASFVGSITELDMSGVSQGVLVNGLNGVYGLGIDNDGNVLASGVSAPDFSSSTVIAVDPMGAVSDRATGFSFSTDLFYDDTRDAALVLDFGVSQITAICTDADDDGVCDADCSDPAAIDGAKLKLTGVDKAPGEQGLTLSGEMIIPNLPAYDPVANGVLVTVDDANGVAVVDVKVPGGVFDTVTKQGWKSNGNGTWTFKSKTGVAGITTVVVKQNKKDPTRVKVKVVGKNAGFAAADATLPLQVVFSIAPDGQCGAADFAAPSCLDTGKLISCR